MPKESKKGANKRCCYGLCKSDSRSKTYKIESPYYFIPFPKPCLDFRRGKTVPDIKHHLQACQKCKKSESWVKLCGRRDQYFRSLSNVNKDTYICSLHFVGQSGPSEAHPNPVQWGLTKKSLKVGKVRKSLEEKYASTLKDFTDQCRSANTRNENCCNEASHATRESNHSQIQGIAEGNSKTDVQNSVLSMEIDQIELNKQIGNELRAPLDAQQSILKVEMNSGDSEIIRIKEELLEDGSLLEISSLSQDIRDPIELKDVKEELYYSESHSLTLEPFIKEETKDSILISTSVEQTAFIKSEVGIENVEIRKDQPIDSNNREIVFAEPWRIINQQNIENDTVQIPFVKETSSEICDSIYQTSTDPRDPLLPHTPDNPKECGICNKKFQRESAKNKHMLIHTGEKPHKCDVCKKAFSTKKTMKQHMLIHSGKKHNCSICGKGFTLKSAMKQHMLIHTEDNPYKCKICRRAFGCKSAIKYHMATHAEWKPHKCSVCKKTFKLSSAMKQHMFIHSEKKPHECGTGSSVNDVKLIFVILDPHPLARHTDLNPLKYKNTGIRTDAMAVPQTVCRERKKKCDQLSVPYTK